MSILLRNLKFLAHVALGDSFQEVYDKMASTQTDLDAQITIVRTAITDLGEDFMAAIKKLEEAIAAGQDLTPQVDALKTMAATLANLDLAAEAVTGIPTPPVPPTP